VFGVGLPELAVIAIIAVIVFGPDRLPDFARQAGRMLRQLRDLSQAARDDIRKELGPEYANFELTDLDPRRAVRKYMSDIMDDDPGPTVSVHAGLRPLEAGELPPYDSDAT
jgi:sec-independent protein translocase protein TatB